MDEQTKNILLKILEDTEAIGDLAQSIDILSINISIESARVPALVDNMIESILDKMIVAQCRLVDVILQTNLSRTDDFWQKTAGEMKMDDIIVTDEDGVITECNDSTLLGWRFPENSKEQAYEFRSLLGKKDGVVCQKVQPRSLDGVAYKFIGVSRSDGRGLIQIALNAKKIQENKLEIGAAFSVIAREIRSLAGQVKAATKRMEQNLARHQLNGQ
jgi:hypothetical protein